MPAAGTFCLDRITKLVLVRVGKSESGVEMGGMTSALELWVLVISSDRVAWKGILHGTLVEIPNGSRAGELRPNPFLTSKCRVFCLAKKCKLLGLGMTVPSSKYAPYARSSYSNRGTSKPGAGRELD